MPWHSFQQYQYVNNCICQILKHKCPNAKARICQYDTKIPEITVPPKVEKKKFLKISFSSEHVRPVAIDDNTIFIDKNSKHQNNFLCVIKFGQYMGLQ